MRCLKNQRASILTSMPPSLLPLCVTTNVAKKVPCGQQLMAVLLACVGSCTGLQAAEVFNGIALEIEPPFLHEKRAMQLHAVMTPQQTQVIAQAMSRIAATVNEAHSASRQERPAWRQNTLAQNIELRNALQASGVNPHVGLAVKQIHNWKISTHHIQFDVDYYMPSRVGNAPEIYRDRYALTHSATSPASSAISVSVSASVSGAVATPESGWHFSGHPNDAPIGKLSCQFVNALWVCPITP